MSLVPGAFKSVWPSADLHALRHPAGNGGGQRAQAAGPQPTREKVLAALETMKFDSGVMAGPIEFGPNDRAAQESAIYIKFDGTSMSLVPFKSVWQYQP